MPEPVKKVAVPKLVNRGGFGLLTKRPKGTLIRGSAPDTSVVRTAAKHRIVPALKDLIVPISTLTPDPLNARKHPERNKQAIKESLEAYGQTKPIVVRRVGEHPNPQYSNKMIVMAGNGTLLCATELGWTEIAASVVEMTDGEAAAYGIADNRTAELAQWDEAVLKQLTRVLDAANQPMIGYTKDELEVLRASEYIPPSIIEDDPDNPNIHVIKLVLTDEQKNIVEVVAGVMRTREANKKLTESECVTKALEEWLPQPAYLKDLEATSAEDSFGSYTEDESAGASEEEVDETFKQKPAPNKTRSRSGGTRRQ